MEEIKVLLVDDEVLARNYLRSLIQWKKEGFSICGEAANGEAALELLREKKPQLVILDVSMPVMDGVSLSQYIYSNHSDIKMIVLSSFDNYDFVRETMKNGAVDYLLKHRLGAEELKGVLRKARRQIEEARGQKEEKGNTLKKLQLAVPALKQSYLKSLVLGIDDSLEDMKEYIYENHSGNKSEASVIAVMQVLNFMMAADPWGDREKGQMVKNVLELCENVLAEEGNGFTAHINNGRFVFLFSFGNLRSEEHIKAQANEKINRIGWNLNNYMNIRIAFGVGHIFHKIEEARGSYNEAMRNLDRRIFMLSDTSGRRSGDLSKGKKVNVSIRQEKMLLAAIEGMDVEGVGKVVEEIFYEIGQHGVEYDNLQMILSELAGIAIKAAMKEGILLGDISMPGKHEKSDIEDFKSYQKWVMGLYEMLLSERKKSNRGRYSKYVEAAVCYIEEHYHQTVSLEKVAQNIGITPQYLSRLFSEETESSFVNYLNAVRIQAAKRLMDRGEVNIKAIHEKVGFHNYNYFFRVFKEITGMTPLDHIRTLKEK